MRGFNTENVTKITRLGRIERGENTKARPLLIGLDTTSIKSKILRNTWRLAESDIVMFQRTGIEHDYTPKQREQRKKLKEEAKEKEQNDRSGNYLYRVRGPPGNMWIKRVPKR